MSIYFKECNYLVKRIFRQFIYLLPISWPLKLFIIFKYDVWWWKCNAREILENNLLHLRSILKKPIGIPVLIFSQKADAVMRKCVIKCRVICFLVTPRFIGWEWMVLFCISTNDINLIFWRNVEKTSYTNPKWFYYILFVVVTWME